MTIQDIVKQGLEAATVDEETFRQWAKQWFPDIALTTDNSDPSICYAESLADWAFGMKNLCCSTVFHNAICLTFRTITNRSPVIDWSDAYWWFVRDATAYDWIITGCVAKWMEDKTRCNP